LSVRRMAPASPFAFECLLGLASACGGQRTAGAATRGPPNFAQPASYQRYRQRAEACRGVRLSLEFSAVSAPPPPQTARVACCAEAVHRHFRHATAATPPLAILAAIFSLPCPFNLRFVPTLPDRRHGSVSVFQPDRPHRAVVFGHLAGRGISTVTSMYRRSRGALTGRGAAAKRI